MPTIWIVCGLLVAAAAVGLAVIVRTKWLQSHTLQKCVLLSVVLHAVLAAVAGFVGGMAPASWGRGDTGRMSMLVVMAEIDDGDAAAVADTAAVMDDTVSGGPPPVAVPDASEARALVDPAAMPMPPLLAAAAAAPAPDGPPTDHVPLLEAADDDDEQPRVAAADEAAADEAPASTASTATAAASATAEGTGHAVPAVYADRVGGRRAAAAAARGGSEETERAVQAALAWLAGAQSADGRWSAARHGGGVERSVQGHHRHGVGAKSDHGVTGLALLAFLGAGNTHREGPYCENVSRGVRYLVERQRADGSLAGDAEFFAALYCHGMAGIALAECCGMTGDAALEPPVRRAVGYTLTMQSPATGGWRYAAGDKGDTSQLGWQLMLLSSARHARIGSFTAAESRAASFLQSVSSGRAGGLAAYRPGERPAVARTAEALFCRFLVGLPADHPAVGEALDMVSRAPPDVRSPNAYAWYYATLASFHAGGPQWDAWNRQMQAAVLRLQRRESSGLDGSWDPDPVWGGHGGRVYATAMAAMTLEVYYRHLPMHRQSLPLATIPGGGHR
jgi:hypothetical protein